MEIVVCRRWREAVENVVSILFARLVPVENACFDQKLLSTKETIILVHRLTHQEDVESQRARVGGCLISRIQSGEPRLCMGEESHDADVHQKTRERKRFC